MNEETENKNGVRVHHVTTKCVVKKVIGEIEIENVNVIEIENVNVIEIEIEIEIKTGIEIVTKKNIDMKIEGRDITGLRLDMDEMTIMAVLIGVQKMTMAETIVGIAMQVSLKEHLRTTDSVW